MPQHLIILLVLVPMAAGVVTMLLHRFRAAQRAVGAVSLLGTVGLSTWALATVYRGPGVPGGVLTSQMGNWPAPFGISVVVDGLAATLLLASSVVTLAVFAYAVATSAAGGDGRFEGGYFHPLYHLLNLGVNWSFVTGDLFNLFVAFEILLMASYALFCLGTTPRQMRQAYKYVLINLVGSTLFVAACGLLYGQLGTLNLAQIARMAMAQQIPASAVPTISLLLVVFGTKSAAFPVWFWLPETYPALPAAVGGLFSGLLTKVGVYCLIRVFVMTLGPSIVVRETVAPVILVSAAFTMLLGVLGAVGSGTVRRILSIHIISQVGYMVLGVGLATKLAIAGTVLYMVQHMVVKCALFLCCGLMERYGGTDELSRLGGLLKRNAWLAALFFVAAMSLVGLPPLSGFFGKWVLIRESLTFAERPMAGYVLGGVALLTGALTLLSMLKIWGYAFWSPEPADAPPTLPRPRVAGPMWATASLVAVALFIGFGANLVFDVAESAAANVVDPTAYVAAVLGPANVTVPVLPAPAVALNN